LIDDPIRKVFLKMHQIARLRVRGCYKDAQIAQHFGLSQSGFARIAASQEYREIEKHVLEGTLDKMDQQNDSDLDAMREKFRKEALPAACEALIAAVRQERDLKSRLAAAELIFDRDPTQTFGKGAYGGSGAGAGVGGAKPLTPDLVNHLNNDNNTVLADFVDTLSGQSKAVN